MDEASEVVEFWRQAGRTKWFRKDPEFDRTFRERFLALHERAAAGELQAWAETATGSLALVILLDQFPRNAFRDSPRMFATDALARRYAAAALEAGFDRRVQRDVHVFFYLPFEHSESLADQDRSVALQEHLGELLKHALEHREVIRRFGRFPHRNAVLGRETTVEERAFLDAGGFAR
jgi:uncharacterized protein (DUF924 family)